MVEGKTIETVLFQDTELPYCVEFEPWFGKKGAIIRMAGSSRQIPQNLEFVVLGEKQFALSYPFPISDKERTTRLVGRLFEKLNEGCVFVKQDTTPSTRKVLNYLSELVILRKAIANEIGQDSQLGTFVNFLTNSAIQALQPY